MRDTEPQRLGLLRIGLEQRLGLGVHLQLAVDALDVGLHRVARQAHQPGDLVEAGLVGAFAIETMLMKNSLLENMSSDYVRTARAKGVPAGRVLRVHILRNALLPTITVRGCCAIF